MAHFYINANGSRAKTTACGTKGSGADAHVRGWNVGCYVKITHENDKDVVRVYKTSGSNGQTQSLIAEYTEEVQS